VAQQVGAMTVVVAGQGVHHRQPALRAVADAVQQ
jgi:hypothetical protein